MSGQVQVRSYRAALREAVPIDAGLVERCVGEDPLFRRAWVEGLDALKLDEAADACAWTSARFAESVATLLMREAGLEVFAELAAPGVHGADMLALTPHGEVLAVEVKGTLRPGTVPRIGRGRLRQMSLEWLDSRSNPAMVEWELTGAEIYGSIAALDLAGNSWRIALADDCEQFVPVRAVADLCALRRTTAALR
jgi:hypothetical protein